jgi:predicted HAD superfamily Cof-like phosphohydrolase
VCKSVFKDTKDFLDKFGLDTLDKPGFHREMNNRLDHMQEELSETRIAYQNKDLEETVDGLIDLIYVAAGTLAMCGVDGDIHWDEVHGCNMTKVRGMTKRGNAYDVKKPEGWVGPNHSKYWEK